MLWPCQLVHDHSFGYAGTFALHMGIAGSYYNLWYAVQIPLLFED